MSEPGPWLAIVGIGEDGVEGLSPAAAAALRGAELVVGGRRHLDLATPLLRGETLPWPSPMDTAYPAILARRGRPVAVLASGDPSWWGVAAALGRLVPPEERRCHPAPSSLSLACARLGWPLQEVAVLSACGRPLAALRPLLQPGARVLVLSEGADTPLAVAALLRLCGMAASRLTVLERLGGPHERVRPLDPAADAPPDPPPDPLNLLAIEVQAAAGAALPLAPGLPDALFEHDGQLTRREHRALTLSALAPRAGELLWDVGAGSGSIGIEWMLRHPLCRAVAVEADARRAARARRNAEALGTPALRVVHGRAPDALRGLPPPDCAFIGGAVRDPAVIEAAWSALPPGGRLVANAVTVEAEATLLALRPRLGGTLLRLSLERLSPLGALHAFRPALPLTQLLAVRS